MTTKTCIILTHNMRSFCRWFLPLFLWENAKSRSTFLLPLWNANRNKIWCDFSEWISQTQQYSSSETDSICMCSICMCMRRCELYQSVTFFVWLRLREVRLASGFHQFVARAALHWATLCTQTLTPANTTQNKYIISVMPKPSKNNIT